MSEFRRLRDIMHEGLGPKPSAVIYKPTPDVPEYDAASARKLEERVNRPVYGRDGQLLYHCAACHDMHFLKSDVPLGHPLFGCVRLCPCSEQFAEHGAAWVRSWD